MARKTDGERIDELQRLVALLGNQTAVIESRLSGLESDLRSHDLIRVGQRLASLEADALELKKWRDESRRLTWSIVIPILTAIAGAVLAYMLKR